MVSSTSIRVKEGIDVNSLTFSFYNTFTFIYAELMGRYYGGGVLELTPNEFKGLPLPYVSEISNESLEHLDTMVRRGSKPLEILDFTDKVILQDTFGLSRPDVDKLRKIYMKLLVRRMKKISLNI